MLIVRRAAGLIVHLKMFSVLACIVDKGRNHPYQSVHAYLLRVQRVSEGGFMITITLPDGAGRSYEPGITGAEIAADISKSLAKRAVALKVDGVLTDLSDPVNEDAAVEIVSRDDPDGEEWNTAATGRPTSFFSFQMRWAEIRVSPWGIAKGALCSSDGLKP